jgi:hypothetical protein
VTDTCVSFHPPRLVYSDPMRWSAGVSVGVGLHGQVACRMDRAFFVSLHNRKSPEPPSFVTDVASDRGERLKRDPAIFSRPWTR